MVEPPVPAIAVIAFSNASRVSTDDGRVSDSTSFIASSPAATAACGLRGCVAGTSFRPGALPIVLIDGPAIVELMERKRIKRVPVLRDGRIVGIVSRANLLRALAGLDRVAAPAVWNAHGGGRR